MSYINNKNKYITLKQLYGGGEVIIDDSVTIINSSAYTNKNIEQLIIPDSVITIGARAFCNNKLTELIIPSSVEHIGDEAFSGNKLKTLTIGDNVEHIGFGAFHDNLQEIVCNEGCTVDENIAIRNAFGHRNWTRTLEDGRAIYRVIS